MPGMEGSAAGAMSGAMLGSEGIAVEIMVAVKKEEEDRMAGLSTTFKSRPGSYLLVRVTPLVASRAIAQAQATNVHSPLGEASPANITRGLANVDEPRLASSHRPSRKIPIHLQQHIQPLQCIFLARASPFAVPFLARQLPANAQKHFDFPSQSAVQIPYAPLH